MMIFLLGSRPDHGLAFLRWRFTVALRVPNKIDSLIPVCPAPLSGPHNCKPLNDLSQSVLNLPAKFPETLRMGNRFKSLSYLNLSPFLPPPNALLLSMIQILFIHFFYKMWLRD